MLARAFRLQGMLQASGRRAFAAAQALAAEQTPLQTEVLLDNSTLLCTAAWCFRWP